MREDCSIILRKAKPPKRNLSKPEFLTLKTLRDNLDIVILEADKGGAIVIMDKHDYDSNMIDHLSNSGFYFKLKKDPLKSVCKDVSLAIKSDSSLLPPARKLIESNRLTPRIYGLPKIPKPGAPLRPIVNTIGGPSYHMAKFLAQKLKPLVGKTDSFVKYSPSFIKEWKNIKLHRGELLISFDVVSLFTKIPSKKPLMSLNGSLMRTPLNWLASASPQLSSVLKVIFMNKPVVLRWVPLFPPLLLTCLWKIFNLRPSPLLNSALGSGIGSRMILVSSGRMVKRN